MPYLAIEDFRRGMDRTRKRVAGEPGQLWTLKNGHISRGGDIERSKRFVSTYTLPSGTFHLAALKSQLYTFGSADLAATVPLGVQYQRLQAPSTPTMTRLLDAKVFAGALYTIAEYDDGSIYHFYDGTRVSDWDTVVGSTVTPEEVAEALAFKLNRDSAISAEVFGAVVQITAKTAGTAFTISGSASDGSGGADTTEDLTVASVQANVAAVTEVQATATVQITDGTADAGVNTINSITIDGTELVATPVDWTGSHATTAINLATEINNTTATHTYTASAAGDTVTLTAQAGTGTGPNGDLVVVTPTGNVAVTASSTVSGGVAAVTAVAQVSKATVSGQCDATDTFTVTINSVDYKVTGLAAGMGTSVYVDKQRVWSTAGREWHYCALGDATDWTTAGATGAGLVDLTETTEANETFVVAARYQDQAVVMSPSFAVVYLLDVDPDNIAVQDTLDLTGTDAPRSVVRYGNNDVFFLDDTGVRSLRARDSSNAPFVSDVGHAIDTFVQETLGGLSAQQRADAVGAVDPIDGRFWLAAGGTIFVLSYFPASRISAWSYYEPDEFDGEDVDAIVRSRSKLYVRAGDEVFLYGGADGDTYPAEDESECVVKLPFLSAGTPGARKKWGELDLAMTGEWSVAMAYDPNDDSRTISCGVYTRTTFNEMTAHLPEEEQALIALEFTCSAAGAATISMVVPHFEKTT